MRYSFAPLALAALVAASPMPQASSAASADCSPNYDGEFMIQVINVTTTMKRGLEKRQQDNPLQVTLEDGVLVDDEGRTGYIASNGQFQFNDPVQQNAIATSGFSVCSNGSLAINGDAIFYECLSGDFYNLYSENDAGQCTEVYIEVIGSEGNAASDSDVPVCELADGQPQVTACVSQISDGQIQASTAAAAPVTQISDGQVQAQTSTALAPVTQISDGQIQAPTSTAVVAPVTQISDGQIQAPTSTAVVAPVTQISDGQIQAPTSTEVVAPVTQISDGQIQAPTSTALVAPSAGTGVPMGNVNGTGVAAPSASVQPYTGAAASFGYSSGLFAIAAGVVAVAML
ncbi:hypothetical protein B0A50_01025 [Salinomyces thailandicus]|uniref:Cell wall mannoprotein PIR1-like C-terminal domain-containing protein n=1 Tax=Salinomyces thailandicus TaxID=706561 RepID=A0A4U0UBI7_9PEZI|nr:hypothetical protein B0A50_01025 [Salinomyces thailandica]